MSTSAGKFGRPKCEVWKYFKFDEQKGKSICIVKLKSQGQDDADALCNKSFNGKFTTNLKLHALLPNIIVTKFSCYMVVCNLVLF